MGINPAVLDGDGAGPPGNEERDQNAQGTVGFFFFCMKNPSLHQCQQSRPNLATTRRNSHGNKAVFERGFT